MPGFTILLSEFKQQLAIAVSVFHNIRAKFENAYDALSMFLAIFGHLANKKNSFRPEFCILALTN